MAIPVQEMEFERIMNMLRPFDWVLQEKKVTNSKLEMTVKRAFEPKEEPIKETILSRAKNPLRMMGWEVGRESYIPGFIILNASKDLSPELKAAAGIP
ncbi:hypothetical protein ES702_07338 [subsurface metagenome]